ncbi:Translocase of chloroplast 34 [Acorus calamus]|uniref:Translocase of chloroplast 34 n=1 Tax=Acorus calamus TaxID=4465 RepID=A0AAV9DUG9_ACOCL|nr:Translocase of chloroplast 34 [Acorus calamus]
MVGDALRHFQSEGLRPVLYSRSRAGFTLNIIDTPGIIEGGYVNENAVEVIKRFLLNKTIDILLYVERLDSYRVDNLDRQVIKAITDSFGKGYGEGFFVDRGSFNSDPYVRECGRKGVNCAMSEAYWILGPGERVVNAGKRIGGSTLSLLAWDRSFQDKDKAVLGENAIPVALVENSGRCNTNDSGEKVLPNGDAWIPSLVNTITDVVSNGSKPIIVDEKLIDGPNPNAWGKIWIPLIAAFQYFALVKGIEQRIKEDIAQEDKPLWELRDLGVADRNF